MGMKVEYINPFTEAAFYVLKEVLNDGSIVRGKLQIRNDPLISNGIATIIGIVGGLKGHVVYDMDKPTACKIASIMNGEELAGIDNMVRSTINEVANMISGNAVTKLAAAGFSCDITPPTFVIGVQTEVYAFKNVNHLLVPLETAHGRFNISLAIEEA